MNRRTVLVVDDHAELRRRIARMLVEAGFDVAGEAADGRQALEMAVRLAPDVITLDVSMPGMSGLEALPRLRAELPGAVIVMLTMNREYEKHALRDGADAYVLKIRATTDLMPAIRAACEGTAPPFGFGDISGPLGTLLARVAQARRRFAQAQREARNTSELSLDVRTEISSSMPFEKTADQALAEYLEALTDLRNYTAVRPSQPNTEFR